MAGSPTTVPMELGDTGPPTVEFEKCDIKCETSAPCGAGAGVEENVKVATKAVEKRVMKNSGEKSSSPIDAADDDDEGDLCRICRTSGEEGSPLYYPCACSGSIKYVHQECLLQWLSHSNARHCEDFWTDLFKHTLQIILLAISFYLVMKLVLVLSNPYGQSPQKATFASEVCKHPFAFSPIYAMDAPARLSFKELIIGLAVKIWRGAQFLVRLVCVCSVWLIFIPYATFWIWRFTFVRSFAEAQRLLASRCVPSLLLTDCLHGFLLSAGIIFIFLGATSLREYFRHLREVNTGHEEEDVGANWGGQVRHHGVILVDEQQQPPLVRVDNNNGEVLEPMPLPQGLAGAGQLLRRNAENVAAQLEIQAARLEAHVEQLLDVVEDGDGPDDVPFDELVGMRGPVFHLVENAITVLVSNAIFLGLVVLIPFTFGCFVLSMASKLLMATGSASAMAAAALKNISAQPDIGLNASSKASEDIASHCKTSASNDTLFNTLFGSGFSAAASLDKVVEVGKAIHKMTEAMVSALKLSDAATVAIGYAIILCALSSYLGLIALMRYNRGQPAPVGRVHGIATMAEAAPSVARQVLAGVKYAFILIKVTFLLVIELGIFPLMCGWWLDVCSLEMLDVTIVQRVSFYQSSPITSSLLHWLAGIVYMLQISIFVSLLREVLRPGVLYFLRNPADPNYNPFRDLIGDPIEKHIRRVLLSILVYASLIVVLTFLPIRLAISVAPFMFPLDIRISDPFTEIPVDMLLFHMCIPFAIEHFRPRATIKSVLISWFSLAGWALGLSDFLLPGPDDGGQGSVIHNNVQQRRGYFTEAVGYLQVYPQRVPAAGHNHNNVGTSSDSSDADSDTDDLNYISEVEDEPSQWYFAHSYIFAMRIGLLLLATWLTLLLFNITLLLLPITIGRTIFASFLQLPMIHGAKCNDLYAFNIGCYVFWATAAAVRYVVYYLQRHALGVLQQQILKWSAITAKSIVLLSLWIGVIPVLIGLLFELVVVMPLRIPVDGSPIFYFYKDWALGLVFLKIWTRLVMLEQRILLADDSWRVSFEQVRADGFTHMRGWWVFKAIIFPILVRLMTAVGVPYVFSWVLFPHLGYSAHINSVMCRFAWSGCLALGISWYILKRLHRWFFDLHNAIRDDRYLVGRRLHNFVDRRRASRLAAKQTPSTSVASVADGNRGTATAAAEQVTVVTPSSVSEIAGSSITSGGEVPGAGVVVGVSSPPDSCSTSLESGSSVVASPSALMSTNTIRNNSILPKSKQVGEETPPEEWRQEQDREWRLLGSRSL